MKKMTPLRILVHLGGILPLVWMAWELLIHQSQFNPIQWATLTTGRIALILLLLTLACTPIFIVTGFSEVNRRRKALGLYTFLYAAIHFTIFIGWDYGFSWGLIWQEISQKRYLIAGIAAGFILLLLAATSFKYWMKRLGKNWKRLHRLVYVGGILAVLHYVWIVKGDVLLLQGNIVFPLLAGVLLVIMLLLRVSWLRKRIVQFRQGLNAH
jgi:sulfoxide reductase heme-binding subunit YedZ